MQEEYKTIEGFENYKISNFGNLINIKKNKIVNSSVEKWGYCTVTLCKPGKKKTFKIHRLVALAFIDNADDKPFIDHIDRNKQNNHISNLRWASVSENSKNVGIRKNNVSTRTGVTFMKSRGKWQASISINGKLKHIGLYACFDDAVTARTEQEAIHYKEFQAI